MAGIIVDSAAITAAGGVLALIVREIIKSRNEVRIESDKAETARTEVRAAVKEEKYTTCYEHSGIVAKIDNISASQDRSERSMIERFDKVEKGQEKLWDGIDGLRKDVIAAITKDK